MYSAHVQINKHTSARNLALLQQLTPYDLDQARKQEEAHQPITNPIVCTLQKHVQVAAKKITGLNAQRLSF